MRITVNIPDDLAACLVPAGRDAARMLLEESAATAYREHRLSVAQLRRLLDMESRFEVEAFLATHEIFDYTVDNLDEDLAKLRQFTR